MTSHRNFRRYRTMTILGASALALSACSDNETFKDWKQGITGERDPQVVEGARHAPALNPLNAPPANMGDAVPPPPPGMMSPPPPPAGSVHFDPANNPYDSYDESGNPVAPKVTAGEQAPPPPRGNFFDRIINGDSDKDTRKPIPGNVHDDAPAPPPQSMAAPAPVISAESEDNSSWFSRSWGKMKQPFAKQEVPPEDSNAASAPYPKLSTVPEKSPEFGVVKSGKQQQMEELQSDHIQAQIEREDLTAEPSQFDANKTAVPTVNVPAAASASEPVLLGHVSDTRTPFAAAPTAAPAPMPIPAPKPVELAQQPAPVIALPAPPPKPMAEIKPLLDDSSKANSPVTVPSPVSPAADAGADQLPAQETAAASDNALPSPDILQEVKVLPPSRYSARARALQSPSEQ